ncbi:MAG: bifunctional DNA-binding transcriptional regulator/O6-methylguanine-DNA methyltransferase Ada [Gammaproteobacteria bacterium]|nr:bifunctional DNA-binding transcriptional regulator/O6-methylguanine-DNA methyltransferase Ada [Gammaproteobacteria bacterium]
MAATVKAITATSVTSTTPRERRAQRTLADPRWNAVTARDASADESFFYSVATTGVYCRPSCGARRPRPEHVAFHATRREAEAAGFRPCRRCRPEQPPRDRRDAALVAAACRIIEREEPLPSLDELAQRVGVGAQRLHRLFRRVTGLTPKAYVAAHRERRMRGALESGSSVTAAILEAGYGSSSRFYERADDVLGMTAGAYRAHGAGEAIRFAVGECSLGAILVAQSGRGVCAISIGDDPQSLVEDLQRRFDRAELVGGDAEFERIVAQVVGFVDEPRASLDLPLDIRGTAFQQRVWQALREIPPGSTASYADIARRIGAPRAVRAVAGACAANPLAVAIPCHRVVRTDGGLSGYRWGIERKRALLGREAGR